MDIKLAAPLIHNFRNGLEKR